MDLHLWATFFAVNLLASLSPGPGAVAAMNAGLAQGSRGGWRLVLGLQLALLLQLSVVALGAGALLAASEGTFQVLRWGGAAYLIWLGLAQWRAAWMAAAHAREAGTVWPAEGLIWRGVLVNLSNPKAVLFMAALVPQFIDTARPLVWQYLLIAVTMCGVDALVMGAYATLAAHLRPWFESARLVRWRNFLFGSVFILLGGALLGLEAPS